MKTRPEHEFDQAQQTALLAGAGFSFFNNQLQILRQQHCMQLFVSRIELTESDFQAIHNHALKIASNEDNTAALTPSR